MDNKESEKSLTLLEGRDLVITGNDAERFIDALENPREVELLGVRSDKSKGLELIRKRFGCE